MTDSRILPRSSGVGKSARFFGIVGVMMISVRDNVDMSIAPSERTALSEETVVEHPWVTIVWNDPINLMSYVTYVFMSYFKFDRAKAELLMLDVHEKGRATVSSGTREAMEIDVAAMHSYGLWATLQKDD